MSSPEGHSELKGGHPPAVKAGGMRITQHKGQAHEKPVEVKKSSDDEAEEVVESTSPPKPQLVISGALARGDADFPTEAIQAFHNKPVPSHDYRSTSGKPNVIHQPRK